MSSRTRSSSRRTRRDHDDVDARAAAEAKTARRRKVTIWAVSIVAALLALTAIAWFTPLLSVRSVEISGLKSVPEPEIRTALAIPDGRPLLRVDTGAAAKRVAQIPKVAQVRVQREYPSTVKVTVTERFAAVFFDAPDGAHVLDPGGVDFAIEPPPPGTPKLTVDHPGHDDATTQAALAVLNSTPPPLRVQVGEVAAKSISDIRLILRDGRTVVWGSRDRSDRKAAIALPLLSQPGKTYDVSSPDLPTVK